QGASIPKAASNSFASAMTATPHQVLWRYSIHDRYPLGIQQRHYFTSGFDWYITEKDMTGAGIDQAFGLAIAPERELGYISIRELVANGAELDLYFDPTTLANLKK
ncbi:MAG: hypothetical protein ACYCQM_14600, partial [Acidithiobacillus sp.]